MRGEQSTMLGGAGKPIAAGESSAAPQAKSIDLNTIHETTIAELENGDANRGEGGLKPTCIAALKKTITKIMSDSTMKEGFLNLPLPEYAVGLILALKIDAKITTIKKTVARYKEDNQVLPILSAIVRDEDIMMTLFYEILHLAVSEKGYDTYVGGVLRDIGRRKFDGCLDTSKAMKEYVGACGNFYSELRGDAQRTIGGTCNIVLVSIGIAENTLIFITEFLEKLNESVLLIGDDLKNNIVLMNLLEQAAREIEIEHIYSQDPRIVGLNLANLIIHKLLCIKDEDFSAIVNDKLPVYPKLPVDKFKNDIGCVATLTEQNIELFRAAVVEKMTSKLDELTEEGVLSKMISDTLSIPSNITDSHTGPDFFPRASAYGNADVPVAPAFPVDPDDDSIVPVVSAIQI